MKQLFAPYNSNHPDSRCSARPGGRRHKLLTTEKGKLVNGVRTEKEVCQYCGDFYLATVDYGLLGNVFSA